MSERLIDALVYVPGPVVICDRRPGDPTPEEIAERARQVRAATLASELRVSHSLTDARRERQGCVEMPHITSCHRHNGRPLLKPR